MIYFVDMDFRYLKAFYLTGKHGSFSEAGRELRVAQSAISRQIRLLEESLDCQLLLRGPGAVSLTPKGQELMIQIGLFSDWAKHFESSKQQVIRIASMEGVAANWLPGRLAKIDDPSLSFELSITSSEGVRLKIEKGEVDLALINEKVESALASSVILFHEPMELISTFNVNLNELEEYRWIFTDKASHLRRLCRKEPRQYVRTGSITTLLELVRRGYGIAVLPAHLLKGETGLTRRPLDQLKDGTIYLAMLNYALVPPAIAQVRKTLIDGAR